MATEGIGTTLTFGTFSGNVVDVDIGEESAEWIDTTPLNSSAGAHSCYYDTGQASKLVKTTAFDVTVEYAYNVNIPYVTQTGTLTITFPDTKTVTGTAYVLGRKPPKASVNAEKLVVGLKFKWSGATSGTALP